MEPNSPLAYDPVLELHHLIIIKLGICGGWLERDRDRYPITVHDDNIGAIFPSYKTLVTQQTKHIYVRHHFICDNVEDGTVKIQYFCSEGNVADPFIKNLSNGPFKSLNSR